MNRNNKLGNSEAFIINDLDIKNKIIDYLFNSVNLKYKLFNKVKKRKIHFDYFWKKSFEKRNTLFYEINGSIKWLKN